MKFNFSSSLAGHNPDVLNCIANLSSDEVFTPPELANRMLDVLEAAWASAHNGSCLWRENSVRFLDPCTKSGVFLREITKRLNLGLKETIPDLEERVDHILTKQVFGIAITRLTSLLARRSVYCSKFANGIHSVAKTFDNSDGNIWFDRVLHSWENGRCRFCGASQLIFDRSEEFDSHAYPLIHTDNVSSTVARIFGEDMKFDVIIGNPPYQITGGGGGTNDSPIYDLFVQQAIQLQPRFLSMVIPSRWMAGGRGLSQFRSEFLRDRRVRSLVDFENAKDIFPTVGIGGGACYFLWDRDNPGLCENIYHRNGVVVGPHTRKLDEFDVFVRDKRAVDILMKVLSKNESSLDDIVSGDTPFGLATNFLDYVRGEDPKKNQIRLYANVGTKRVSGALERNVITKNTHLIKQWKLFLPVAGSGRERERTGLDLVIGPSIVGEKDSACTQTYLVCGPLKSKAEAKSVESYLQTRLARFLISLRKPAQHVFRGMYKWVPMQMWGRKWTDVDLYIKYGLNPTEIAYIESVIRPMSVTNE
ncbi:MAG: restriction endonuclease [Proteobacteria bacterium]|nr:MAG: restriction endonuclease [Pseudomonadota bacterium]